MITRQIGKKNYISYQMNKVGKAVIAVVIMVFGSVLVLQARQMNLPTVKVGGVEMYYYTWKKGDSVYGVAKSLGVTIPEIEENNPSVRDGVKAGEKIYFPIDEDEMPAAIVETPAEGPTSYIVQKGDTFYSIARRYGLTPEELTALNPDIASNVIKPGQRLWVREPSEKPAHQFFADKFDDKSQNVAQPEAAEGQEIPSRDATPSISVGELLAAAQAKEQAERLSHPSENSELSDTLRAAVFLPFMLSQPEEAKTTRLFTEFFRGMLLAADSLGRLQGQPVKLTAYDTAGSMDTLRLLLSRPEMMDYDAVVAPSESLQVEMLASGLPTDTEILNIFGVKGEVYLENPNVVQTNIPTDAMYDRAIEAFMQRSDEALPVFLSRNGGPADKDRFTAMLKLKLMEQGRDFREVSYGNTLYMEDLKGIEPDSTRVIFIPASGSKTEFAKISNALTLLRERTSTYGAVTLWGYPEWITFRGDAFDDLCNLNATIYSRFFANEGDPQAQAVRQAYTERFGEEMFDAVPTQGLLGFDTGVYIINGLRDASAAAGEEETEVELPDDFSGLQSAFHLIRPEAKTLGGEPGKVNNALYLIHYAPGGNVTKTVL